jgi:hypothetical protein
MHTVLLISENSNRITRHIPDEAQTSSHLHRQHVFKASTIQMETELYMINTWSRTHVEGSAPLV